MLLFLALVLGTRSDLLRTNPPTRVSASTGLLDSCLPASPQQSTSPPSPETVALDADASLTMYQSATSQPGAWKDLTTVDWTDATTGWQRLADDDQPRLGQAFPYTGLLVNGQGFDRGIGTYPLSEIVYTLGGRYSAISALAALDDTASADADVRFSVYADDVLVYQSSNISAGQAPTSIQTPIMGADEVRLVVESTRTESRGAYADWLTPQLYAPSAGASSLKAAHAFLDRAHATRVKGTIHASGLVTGLRRFPSISGADSTLIATVGSATVWFDRTQCLVSVMNPFVEAAFGYGGSDHGRLFFAPATADAPELATSPSNVILTGSDRLSLAQTKPDPDYPWQVDGVSDSALGAGVQVTLHLLSPTNDPLAVLLSIYEGNSYLTYQIRPGGAIKPRGYAYLGPDAVTAVGAQPRYLSDRGQLWRGRVPDDGITRDVPLESTKPFMLWSDTSKEGLILGTLDPSEGPMQVSLAREPGETSVGLDMSMTFTPDELQSSSSAALSSPRLWIEPASAANVFGAFGDYAAVMHRLYPSAPMPDWVRYQWGSWWTYGPTPTEEGIKTQVDAIAQKFSDLGPWHILIDAAWYVAYGRPDADMRHVDYEKFPNGIEPVVDYAHAQNVDIVMYVSGGFLHSGLPYGGEWQAFQETIDEHPDWLIPLFDDDSLAAYMLNYRVPAVRQYLQEVVGDVIQKYGADGVEVDGLGDPEGQITNVRTRDLHEIASPYLPALEVYKTIADRLYALRPDAYMEGGWVNPLSASGYAQTFFLSDETPAFSHPYPFGGLVQHIDYALFQWVALGQRAKMANVRGAAGDPATLQWIDASLATGAQVSLGFDLSGVSGNQLSALRSRLAHYDPFKGNTVTSSAAKPSAFATIREHIAYVGVVNRTTQSTSLADEVSQLGVIAPGLMAYDVEQSRWIQATDVPEVILSPQSFRLFLIPEQPRITWSNASWSYEPSDDSSLIATVNGPSSLSGAAQIWAPGTQSVTVDGSPLSISSTPGAGRYTYDQRTGVVRLAFDFSAPHRIEVRW